MSNSSNLKILIVGAGIGGLATAIRLKQHGFEPEVVDKTKHWKMKGYSLTLWPNALQILDILGIGNEVRNESKEITGAKIFDKNGKVLGDFSFRDFNKKYNGPYQVYRVDLHRALREKAEDLKIEMNETVVDLDEHSDKVDVKFSDGKTKSYDIVIAADGIHSSIRGKLFPMVKPDYLGIAGWLFWIPKHSYHPDHPTIALGHKKMVAVYDHGDERHVVAHFALIDKFQGEDEPQHRIKYLKNLFGDMKGFVPKVLENLPHDNESFFHYDHMKVETKHWHTKRVVFVGDAAHATSPFSAMGAAMALEDAYVLAEEIANHSDNIQHAFENYFQRRFPRVKKVLKQANAVEYLLRVNLPLNKIRDYLLKRLFGKIYLQRMEKIISEEI